MTPREERGLIIAATCRLNRLPDGTWLVPSQTAKTGGSAYRVNLEAKTCTCLDHTETVKCGVIIGKTNPRKSLRPSFRGLSEFR